MPEDHINELRDVAFRKIGRNLVNFQQFERALKLIIVRSDVRGYVSELAKILRDKDKDIDRKPLGWLVQGFFKTVYSNHASHDGPANELDEVWMSVSVRIESNKDSIRDRRRQLRELVKERNLLVHRLLANFDPDSVESCEKLISLLDEQVDRMEHHYQSLMGIIGNMQAAQHEILKQLEAHLRESVREGGDAAENKRC
jgi:hypothetical protein